MAWSESDVKTDMVKQVKELGGYARRIEDQYAVGMFDMIIVMPYMPVLFVEVKLIRDNKFGPTPRQYVEGKRIINAGPTSALPLLVGFEHHPDRYRTPFEWVEQADRRNCYGSETVEQLLEEVRKWVRTARPQLLYSTPPRR